ncbi:pilus assembly protein TadG-related protein [Methylocystis parvus OBBP]|nr:pilus assembly protein TadG-related protein [Methylocystis parvus]WBK00598.1 pilus assembly protein TadG-related protein [Methylocystis parvus OBBP]
MIPIFVMMGSALDYTRAATMRTRLNRLSDRAALAAVKAAAQKEADCVLAKSSTGDCSLSQIQTLGEAAGAQYILADMAFQNYGTAKTLTLAKNDTSWSATVNYTAEMPAAMTKLMGFNSIPVKGSVTSNISMGSQLYLNVRMLLDNSMSMGIGATSDDITRMQALTGCAFGCHTTSYATTYYKAPKAQGIRFRIDDLRDATTALVATAKTVTASNARNHIKMAAYSFDHTTDPLVALTSDLTAVGSAVQALDLPTADDGTQAADAIAWLASQTPNSGDGLAPDRPQEVAFLVTDGVEDGIYTGWNGMSAPTGLPLSWWSPSLTKANTGAFPVGSCDALKQKDVIVAVVYTTYVPFVGTEQYDKLIGPFASNIEPNLQSCATNGYFYVASQPGDIQKGMQQLFNKAMAATALRLTQ